MDDFENGGQHGHGSYLDFSKIEEIISNASDEATNRCHEYTTLEHVMKALINDGEISEFLKENDINKDDILRDITSYLTTVDTERGKQFGSGKLTNTIHMVLKRTILQKHFLSGETVSPILFLHSALKENDSPAVFIANKHGLTAHVTGQTISQNEGENPFEHAGDGGPGQMPKDPLKAFCTNLNELAKEEKIDQLIGRQFELEELVQTLARRKKNNVVLVGDPGVGKTAIAEGLAVRIQEENVPDNLKGHTIYSLDIGALMAGTRYRGEFEERMKVIIMALEKKDDSILFIDEIHTIIGAGSGGNSSLDMANLLKPALQRGTLRCIGSTTYEEFKKCIEKDSALNRRFRKVDIVEPTAAEAKDILKSAIPAYKKFHKMKIHSSAIELAVDLSVKFIHDRRLPDKAFDLIDSAFARQKTYPETQTDTLTNEHIAKECSRLARVPLDNVITLDKEQQAAAFTDIEKSLQKVIYGQDTALKKLADAVYISQAGLKDPNTPMGSFLFTGPSGVGKTESVKQLSELLGVPLVRFDMSEYQEKHTVAKLIGSPPGYVGFGDGAAGSGALISEIEKAPNCVLLLDEVEKAHPDVLSVLLQVMDNGMVTSSDNKTVSARNIVMIMTSNLGAADAEKEETKFSMGFDTGQSGQVDKHTIVDEAVKKFFPPEFRNRLDAVVKFNKLSQEHILKVVVKFLNELKVAAKERGCKIKWTKEVVEWIADKGYDPGLGARPMKRTITEYIKIPMAKTMLFESPEILTIDVKDNTIQLISSSA